MAVLSPVIPMNLDTRDEDMQTLAAKAFVVCHKALKSLQAYYGALTSLPSGAIENLRQVGFPYPSHFTTAEGLQIKFKYNMKPFLEKLFFIGKTEQGSEIMLKFCRRYCKEAHASLASLGFAPKLLACERLAGAGTWWLWIT